MPSKRCPRCYEEETVGEWVVVESNEKDLVGVRMLHCANCDWRRWLKKPYSGSMENLEAGLKISEIRGRHGQAREYSLAWIGGAE